MSRRGNGEGTVTRRKDGRWEARITVGMNGLTPIRKSFYGATRSEVSSKLTVALREVQRGITLPTDERTTIDVYLKRWLSESVQPRVRPRTYELYEGIVRNHLVPHIGARRLTKLSPEDV